MNLLLRPLNDINDPVWSVIISIIILLIGVSWVIRYILLVDTREAQDIIRHNVIDKNFFLEYTFCKYYWE